jgi:predicted ArsR family transcriptional regulator
MRWLFLPFVMPPPSLNARFFESTKGQIVELLRRNVSTVDELAAELGVTDNAVRLHLGALERDGLIRARGVRREGGVGKPATIYEIAPAAEPLFSTAYVPLLTATLAALGHKLEARDLRALMRDVGHRLAGQPAAEDATLAERAAIASGVLNALGGVTAVEPQGDGRVGIKGCSCPLASAVVVREEVCLAVQTMLADVTGARVREKCDRTGRPTCCFELSS